MESIDAFIDRLPKAELHLHLVGSASVPTVLELARRHPDSTVPRSAAELAAFYEFRDFPHFSQVYGAVSSLVREPADVAELVLGAARDLAGQNVRYAELTVTPYTFTSAGMPVAGLTEALDIAARSAVRDHGVRMAYIFDIAGEYGAPAAFGTLEHALTCPPEALTGFGLAGIEQARPGFVAEFRSVFASAIAAGLHSVPHAGEMSGPATIWEALDGLRAERIGHGISCLDDPALVARLRESQIPLEVCPTSNACTRQVPGLAAHPLPRLLDEGLFVTLNSDDPPMFGTTLTEEYRRAASVLGLSRAQLAGLAANGVQASLLDAGTRQALLAEIEAVSAGVGAESRAAAPRRAAFPRKRPPEPGPAQDHITVCICTPDGGADTHDLERHPADHLSSPTGYGRSGHPNHRGPAEPRQCGSVVVLTTTMCHRRASVSWHNREPRDSCGT
jgi:aminodeoxyfutalosine deaminase